MASTKSETVELKSEVDDDQEFKMGNVNSSHEFHHPTPLPGYFTCNICDFESKKKYGLDKHIKLLHRSVGGPSNVMECNSCNFKFTTRQLLKNNKRARHLNEKRFSCNTCDYKSFYNQAVQNHVKTKHKDSNTAISLKLSEIDGPVISLKLGEGPKKVPKIDGSNENTCTYCSFVTQKGIYLKRHLLLSHGEESDPSKIIHCESCEFETLRAKSLKDHTNAQHLNQKRFSCSECGFKSYYDQHVQSHIASKHKGSKEAKVLKVDCSNCTLNINHSKCQRSLKNRVKHKTISKSEAISFQKKEKVCTKCPFVTKTQHYLKRHLLLSHGPESDQSKIMACKSCEYETNRKRSMKDHTNSMHLNQKRFN